MSEPDASSTTKGISFLDVDPTFATIPIAVGKNSPSIEQNLEDVAYANDLAAAVTAIGSTPVWLVISRPTTVTSNLTVPANIILDVRDAGLITVRGGYTLEISSLVEASNRQIFAGNDGSDQVYLLRGATSYINFAWWAGSQPSGDADWAMKQCISSLIVGAGGRLVIPSGDWEVSGTYNIPDRSIIEGCGTYIAGTACSSIRLTANQSALFTITARHGHQATIHNHQHLTRSNSSTTAARPQPGTSF